MAKDIDVLVIGSLNFDIVSKQERLPMIGETYVAKEMIQSAGGKGANQAVQSSKLGLKTTMLGAVGNDAFGQSLKKSLIKYHVNVENLLITESTTGIGLVTALNDGEVYATISRGANFEVSPDIIENNEALFSRAKIVCLQLEIPLASVDSAIRLAKRNNCLVILNGAPATTIDNRLLHLIDYFIVNEEEAGFYSKIKNVSKKNVAKAAKKLYSMGVKNVIITLGSKGSYLFNSKNEEFIESIKVDAVDTTGAGDSYIGAFMYGLLQQFSLEDSCIFASKVSSKTVQGVGAQSSMPWLKDMK
ncbi:ribokinase [Aerococcaceae bacterium zg-BR22]|uniref:ribokinase n=1 Tax=Aerococcaceae bacterium zg-1292 TaxID=2774330 RepID=UPI004063D235|nr:ribokinase [Aerococcaceae bacterium zg-BR22]